jgi:hypothetical protein
MAADTGPLCPCKGDSPWPRRFFLVRRGGLWPDIGHIRHAQILHHKISLADALLSGSLAPVPAYNTT